MLENISRVVERKMCSACGACFSICPRNCISFRKSTIGRCSAEIDSQCVNCGLCLKVCPSVSNQSDDERFYSLDKKNILIAQSADKSVLLNSQSGGGVTAILSLLFRTQKIDAALVVDTNKCIPTIVTAESQLYKSQKSVYTPISLLTEINNLSRFKAVAVVGLPCHLTGVVNIMKYRNLPIKYKIGLICDRHLCETLATGIRKYFNLEKGNEAVVKWRDKMAGVGYNYKNAPITIWKDDKMVGIVESNIRQRLKNIFTPPSCRCCPDKLNINADVVFGDPWGLDQSSEMGSSLIIVNTWLGQELITKSIEAGCLSVIRNCTSAELNLSQHILERKDQTKLYSCILQHSNAKCQGDSKKVSKREYFRALLSVYLFRFFEILPKKIIELYIKVVIKFNKKV